MLALNTLSVLLSCLRASTCSGVRGFKRVAGWPGLGSGEGPRARSLDAQASQQQSSGSSASGSLRPLPDALQAPAAATGPRAAEAAAAYGAPHPAFAPAQAAGASGPQPDYKLEHAAVLAGDVRAPPYTFLAEGLCLAIIVASVLAFVAATLSCFTRCCASCRRCVRVLGPPKVELCNACLGRSACMRTVPCCMMALVAFGSANTDNRRAASGWES